jgi:hypothetical protein
MNKREALSKLKKFWLENDGGDYLNSLLQLQKELPKDHKSLKSLVVEIEAIEGAHSDFLLWKETAAAKRKRGVK